MNKPEVDYVDRSNCILVADATIHPEEEAINLKNESSLNNATGSFIMQRARRNVGATVAAASVLFAGVNVFSSEPNESRTPINYTDVSFQAAYQATKLKLTEKDGTTITPGTVLTPGQFVKLNGSFRRYSTRLKKNMYGVISPTDSAQKAKAVRYVNGVGTDSMHKMAVIDLGKLFAKNSLTTTVQIKAKAPLAPDACKQGKLGTYFKSYTQSGGINVASTFVEEDFSKKMTPATITAWIGKLCNSSNTKG